MKIQEDIHPVTYLKMRAADVLNQINQTHRPMIITQNGEPKAVIQDAESYERMKSVLGLMKLLAQGETDIRKGNVIEQNRLFSSIESKLKKRARRSRKI